MINFIIKLHYQAKCITTFRNTFCYFEFRTHKETRNMDSQFSPRIKDVLSYSREEAIRLGNESIGLEHIFLGILRDGEGIAIEILTNLGVNLAAIKLSVEEKLRTGKDIDSQASVQLLKSAEKALKLVYLEARAFNGSTIN